MFRATLATAALSVLMLLAHPAAATDLLIDGVPLPADAKAASTAESQSPLQRRWSGVWVGAWGGSLKHILVVESVAEDGTARVVYATGDNPFFGIQRMWSRHKATVTEHRLTIAEAGFSATYELSGDGALKATYARGNVRSRATMAREDLAVLTRPGAVVQWTRGRSELIATELIEDGRPIRLEVVIFKPSGEGPFPLAVINHGSTGRGTNPALFTQTWFDVGLADFLNERGWIVGFPQRRGRGKSDGQYDEGFSAERAKGYTCDADISLAGADRALRDIEAIMPALKRRPDVARSPILIGGQSRGGVLSVAYSGAHAEQIFGVINVVGGWVGDSCVTANAVNQTLFEQGGRFKRPTLWLYGRHDPFYSISHSRNNFAAFQKAGGQGSFLEFDVPGSYGHDVIRHPQLWSAPIGNYLSSLAEDKQ
jgi:pimeloyl-ACP methyl ester carboxylesterase